MRRRGPLHAAPPKRDAGRGSGSQRGQRSRSRRPAPPCSRLARICERGRAAPTISSVKGGTGVGQMTLRWSAPMSDGGVAITSYEYAVSVDGGAFSAPATSGIATARYAAVLCPAPQSTGHGCAFQVRAEQWNTRRLERAPSAGVWSAPGLPMFGPRDRRTGRRTSDPALARRRRAPADSPCPTTTPSTTAPAWSAPTSDQSGCHHLNAHDSVARLCRRPSCAFLTTPGPIRMQLSPLALNAVGSSTFNPTRIAYCAAPVLVGGLQGARQLQWRSVSGAATQSVSWSAPTSTGGLAISLTRLFACATAAGTLCQGRVAGLGKGRRLRGQPRVREHHVRMPR